MLEWAAPEDKTVAEGVNAMGVRLLYLHSQPVINKNNNWSYDFARQLQVFSSLL